MNETLQMQENVLKADAGQPEKKQRIELIDAARGVAVTLMVIHHALWDLYYYFDAPVWVYRNPVFTVLQMFFVGLFVFVSGIVSRYSRDNIGRGAITFFFGMVITYVTVRILNTPIYFGILHMLGILMMFYGASRRFLDKIPAKTAICSYIALIFISALAREFLNPTSTIPPLNDLLSALGWKQAGYIAFDYQTILPWIFVFLLGTRVGVIIKEGRFPDWFYKTKVPFFPLIGRNALIIYLLHQPILYALFAAAVYLYN